MAERVRCDHRCHRPRGGHSANPQPGGHFADPGRLDPGSQRPADNPIHWALAGSLGKRPGTISRDPRSDYPAGWRTGFCKYGIWQPEITKDHTFKRTRLRRRDSGVSFVLLVHTHPITRRELIRQIKEEKVSIDP